MLFWQRKSTHKRFVLWAKLAAISAVVHVVLLAYFFFVFKDRSSRLSLVITPDMFDREVLFTIAPQPKKAFVSKKTPVASVPKNKTVQKKVAKQTTIASKPSPKAVAKKTTMPVVQKKAAPKKTTPAPAKPKPQVAKKADTHKPVVSSTAKKTASEKEKAIPAAQAAPKKNELAATNHHELEVHHIGIHEKGLLEEFKALHEDIVSKWAPPPGVAPDCSCQVTVLIDWKGALRDITINESSGVLMYDTAAQKALTQIEMPKWTWGKEITITFNH